MLGHLKWVFKTAQFFFKLSRKLKFNLCRGQEIQTNLPSQKNPVFKRLPHLGLIYDFVTITVILSLY